MNKHIEKNKYGIRENEKKIQENKSEIERIKDEFRWTFESCQARLERIIHRLIIVVILAIALLVITNTLWIVAWNQGESMSIINKDGTTNVVGHDGNAN